ncbi:MAG: ParA family protein [Blastocatellia bacterium]
MSFVDVVAGIFEQQGYYVSYPGKHESRFALELHRLGRRIAVQVKEYQTRCNVNQVEKVIDFLESKERRQRFSEVWLITSQGYYDSVSTYVQASEMTHFRLGTVTEGKLRWVYPAEPGGGEAASAEFEQRKYIGVFTSKGGVGKTTVAAHLAGAFALMGHEVALLDLDPDRNLQKLFAVDPSNPTGSASLFVPPVQRDQPGSTITVLTPDQWPQGDVRGAKVVICDCSPVLAENPSSLVERFDYCLIPTLLTPLGIAKNADVILRTFQHVREINARAEMFAFINGYMPAEEERNDLFLTHLRKHLAPYLKTDDKSKFVHPRYAHIRHSLSLLYWGEHIVKKTRPQLAFQKVGGRSYPLADFLNLAKYLERHTEIE